MLIQHAFDMLSLEENEIYIITIRRLSIFVSLKNFKKKKFKKLATELPLL